MRTSTRVRYTTYFNPEHLEILRRLSKVTGRPICALIAEGLDIYLNEELGELEERTEPKPDFEYYRKALDKVAENEFSN